MAAYIPLRTPVGSFQYLFVHSYVVNVDLSNGNNNSRMSSLWITGFRVMHTIPSPMFELIQDGLTDRTDSMPRVW